MSTHRSEFTLRFRHCDPAGIAFYPRLVELVNDTVEDWFTALDYGFASMHGITCQSGVPTAQLNVQFKSPARLGERLQSDLTVRHIGKSSVQLAVDLRVQTRAVMCAEVTLVHVHNDPREGAPSATPWPEAVRLAMQDYLSAAD